MKRAAKPRYARLFFLRPLLGRRSAWSSRLQLLAGHGPDGVLSRSAIPSVATPTCPLFGGGGAQLHSPCPGGGALDGVLSSGGCSSGSEEEGSEARERSNDTETQSDSVSEIRSVKVESARLSKRVARNKAGHLDLLPSTALSLNVGLPCFISQLFDGKEGALDPGPRGEAAQAARQRSKLVLHPAKLNESMGGVDDCGAVPLGGVHVVLLVAGHDVKGGRRLDRRPDECSERRRDGRRGGRAATAAELPDDERADGDTGCRVIVPARTPLGVGGC